MKHLLAVTLAAASAIPALAQTPPKPPNPADMAKHQVKRLTTLLTLTSAQQQQATVRRTLDSPKEEPQRSMNQDAVNKEQNKGARDK